MRSILRVALCGTGLSLSQGAMAQTPAEIFEQMDNRKRASLAGINDFSEMKTTMGQCTVEHFERATAGSGDGAVEYMRLVPLPEVLERLEPNAVTSQASAEDFEHAAAVIREQALKVDTAVELEMLENGFSGLPSDIFMSPPPDEPWLSPRPGDMFDNYAMMLDAAAGGKRENARLEAEARAEARTNVLATMAERTRVVGRETLRDRPAIHLIAEDLDHTEATADTKFTLDTLRLWVDAERYVPLKMQMEGVATGAGETRELRIERENMAYRSVEGCFEMYEPQRTVMRIAGVLSPQEQRQFEEAQQQLEQMESQLANLPQAQRDFIMRQMGPQMQMLRSMSAGNGIEVVSLTVGMRCNADLPTAEEYMQTVPGYSGAACIGFVGEGSQ